MMEFLIYDAKVALALLVFYLFYRFLLKKGLTCKVPCLSYPKIL